jgi:hypothetical protein
LTAHAALANAAFVAIQVLIGVGLFWRRSVKWALGLSIPWALGVWLLGESAGGLFSPGGNALTGAPGAALIYALVALLLWPRGPDQALEPGSSGLLPRGAARGAWVLLWCGTALMWAEALNRSSFILGATVAAVGAGDTGLLGALHRDAGEAFSSSGGVLVIALALAQVAIGFGLWSRRFARPALIGGIVLALGYGLVGQDFGGLAGAGWAIFTQSGATDPGCAPALLLLALALWPRRAPGMPAPSGARREAPANEAVAARSLRGTGEARDEAEDQGDGERGGAVSHEAVAARRAG